jgi:opacity protein-like surface antigen
MTRAKGAFVSLGLALVAATGAPAEGIRPEIFGRAGVGRLSRVEDRSFGAKPWIGGGLGVKFGSLGVEAEVSRMLGSTLDPATCGVISPPCVGSAREGMRSAGLAGANVLYYFGASPTQFFVTGGAGVLWSKEVTTVTQVGPAQATFGEAELTSTGFAWNVGAGVRIPLTARLSLKPEVRFYDASIRPAPT